MVNTQIELLAPAGNMEALRAAIHNGANAVYLGGKAFSARSSAPNFTPEELKEAVKYAHLHDARIYVTVNTLISDTEMLEVIEYLHYLYAIGVDAVIVQDLGVVKILHDLFPNFEVHASTQMTIHNTAGIEFLRSYGISRVVLAREVSLEDIRAIYQRSKAELEIFVHGALCICYSGQCLMSSMIGGRSGNRGKCAQPCRLKYRLISSTGQEIAGSNSEHLLSPKDLNTIEFLPEIISSGVHSLKLEGRMKRPEYVATVIRVYRQALDRYYANPSAYSVAPEEIRDLAQIFNREFTSGYYFSNQGAELMSYKRPNNRGLFLGRIHAVNPEGRLVSIKLKENIAVNDGIELWVTKGGRLGSKVYAIWHKGERVLEAKAGQEVQLEIEHRGRVGDRIFKTHDAELINKAQESYRNAQHFPKIPINLTLKVRAGEPVCLTAEDNDRNRVVACANYLPGQAEKRPLTEAIAYEQLNRLGNTPFTINNFTADIGENVMVPLSELNKLRREAVTMLEQNKGKNEQRESIGKELIEKYLQEYISENTGPLTHQHHVLAVVVNNIAAGLAALEAGADRIYLDAEAQEVNKTGNGLYRELIKQAAKKGCSIVIALPRIWHEYEERRVRHLIGKFEEDNVAGFLVGNVGTIKLLQQLGSAKAIYGDYPLNIFNNLSLALLEDLKLRSICISPELNFQQIDRLAIERKILLECIVHGSLPLMVSEHCAVGALVGGRNVKDKCCQPCLRGKYALKDRLNMQFPIEMDGNCRMYVYNAKDLCLLDDIPRFGSIPSLRVEARRYGSEAVKAITEIYRYVLDAQRKVSANRADLVKYKQVLRQYSPNGFTKGHYYRGVL